MALTLQDVVNARDARGVTRLTAVTPSADELAFVPAWILVSVDTTVTMTFVNAVSAALPLKAGVMYPYHPVKITAVAAGTCWIAEGHGQS